MNVSRKLSRENLKQTSILSSLIRMISLLGPHQNDWASKYTFLLVAEDRDSDSPVSAPQNSKTRIFLDILSIKV